MEESLIMKKLENVDKELHLIMDEMKKEKPKKTPTLAELNKIMEKDRVLGVDTTKLIREMRNKEYDL